MKQYILTLTTIFVVFVSQAQSNFSFTSTNSSAIFNGQAQINGVQLTSNDTIAAYDTSGNCCGAVALINYNGDAYINLVIYGDDATTPSIDEGINGTENFYLHLYDSSEDTILIYQSINNIVSFTGWSNTNGTPLALYNDPNIVYDFTFSIYGCTDPLAFNYDATANTDDGSCIAVALGCTDPLAFNYDATANTDDSSCIAVALGCTDIIACNYDSLANTDDGSCNYASSSTINTNTCDSIVWNGITYDSSGTYININTNNFGCPDTNTLILTINNSTSNTATIIECDSYTWSVDGNTYTTSGIYTNVSTNTTGCTHIDTLVLTINNSTSTVTTITSCDNYTWPIDGNTYTASSIYTSTSINAVGCTHVDSLFLMINNSTSNSATVTTCDSYFWSVDGNTYITSGTYINVSTNTAGCTYIDSLVLTINNSSSSTASIIECDSYTWFVDSTIYTASGIYTNVSTNASGCTHIDTLTLTLNSSTSTTTIINACDSLYSWSVNGITYTSNGTYIDSSINLDGCLHTEILILTLDNSTTNTTTIVECDSYTWSVNGIVYISSGVYIDSSLNINGCIHVDTLDLTLDYTSIYNYNISICQGDVYTINNSIYSTSGYYIDSILDVNCWSIINTNLTVGNTLTSSISQVGNILASNVIGGFPPYSYQWNTFDTTANITTSLNGQYWLIISDSLNCPVDTTYFYVDIHSGISDFGINELSIYPNPSDDVFNISFKSNNAQDFSVRILNVIGEKLIVEDLQQFIGEYSKKISLNQNSKGIYFLEIETKNGIINKKIILN